MSVITSTPQQICNSPLNTSTAKMQFSFTRSPRFGGDIKPVCTQAFYDLPPVKMQRTTALGYGTKYDFTQNAVNNPPPNSYKLPDNFDPATNKKKGYSFGLSRDAMAVTGGQYIGDKASPGPGAYDTRGAGKVTISYTFKGRTTAPEGLTTSRHVPGPGTYPLTEALNTTGKYFVSKYKNSGAPTISPARSDRFPTLSKSNLPAPGSYTLQSTISPKGSYYLSKFKSSGVRSFGHELRSPSQSSFHTAPGPGSYKLPSDFGYYESKFTKTNESTAKSP